MTERRRVRIGDLCSRVTSGGTPSTKHAEYYGGSIPWLRTQEVDFNRITDTEVKITEEGLKNSSAKWIPANAVIVAMYGATAGRIAIAKVPLTTNQACCNLIVDPQKADYRYVYYALMHNYVELSGRAKGSAQTNLNAGLVKEFEIPDFDLPTQKRIADILSAYDDLIENNRRRVEILEESARLIFKERFGEEDTTGVLADICEEIRRAVKPSDVAVDTPYIGLEHMPRRSISLCQWEGAGKVTSTKHGFNEGEILFGKIRPYFHKVGLAFVDGVASSDAIVIRPLKAELRNYVLLTVSSDDFVAAASQGMKEGSKMPRADWGLLLKYPVPIPAEKTLANFNQLIEPIMQQLKALCFTNRKLAEARDVLLPKLMNETMGFDKGESK